MRTHTHAKPLRTTVHMQPNSLQPPRMLLFLSVPPPPFYSPWLLFLFAEQPAPRSVVAKANSNHGQALQ